MPETEAPKHVACCFSNVEVFVSWSFSLAVQDPLLHRQTKAWRVWSSWVASPSRLKRQSESHQVAGSGMLHDGYHLKSKLAKGSLCKAMDTNYKGGASYKPSRCLREL